MTPKLYLKENAPKYLMEMETYRKLNSKKKMYVAA